VGGSTVRNSDNVFCNQKTNNMINNHNGSKHTYTT